MNDLTIEVTEKLWVYPGKVAWYFLLLPKDVSAQIRFYQARRPGFGSVRVVASIGETVWNTSLFPDAKSGGYLLPIKAPVRKAEGLRVDDVVTVKLIVAISIT
jgi:hypothetical protein